MALVAAVLFSALLLFAIFYVATTSQERWMSIAIISLGYVIGWVLGDLLSPYDFGERQRFAEYAGAVAVFATGYLAAKTDKLVENALSVDVITKLSTLTAFRVTGFVMGLLLAMLTTYASREYGDFHLKEQAVAMADSIGRFRLDSASRDSLRKLGPDSATTKGSGRARQTGARTGGQDTSQPVHSPR